MKVEESRGCGCWAYGAKRGRDEVREMRNGLSTNFFFVNFWINMREVVNFWINMLEVFNIRSELRDDWLHMI